LTISRKLTVSYAQNFEDILLWRLFRHQKSGFYVDVGAAHPTKDSVTRLFYLNGWSGINVEPNPGYFSLLKRERPKDINLCCAVADYEGEAEFQFVSNDPNLSSLGKIPDDLISKHQLKIKPIKIRVSTLHQILMDHQVSKIDFLKIDAEGFEKQVLAGAQLQKHPPRVLLIESVAPKEQRVVRDEWLFLLAESRYRRAYFDGINDYFVKETDGEALETFRVPLNASDNFIRAEFLKKKYLLRQLLKF
jgi:FkbM family methyltransferase